MCANREHEGDSPPGLIADTQIFQSDEWLTTANVENGSRLIDEYGCGACHRQAADRIAPSFVGLAERASSRPDSPSAEVYIYESIMFPGKYIVEGYADSMVKNYPDRLSTEELGDIIAYLLSADAH